MVGQLVVFPLFASTWQKLNNQPYCNTSARCALSFSTLISFAARADRTPQRLLATLLHNTTRHQAVNCDRVWNRNICLPIGWLKINRPHLLIVELRKMDNGSLSVGICGGKSKPKMFFVLDENPEKESFRSAAIRLCSRKITVCVTAMFGDRLH
jgi:hypothetical protein